MLGIRLWQLVWTRIKSVLTEHVGTKLTKPFKNAYSPNSAEATGALGNIFARKSGKTFFLGSFPQQLLLLRSHRFSCLFLLLCGKKRSERNSVGTLDTKTSSEVKSTPVFMHSAHSFTPFSFDGHIHSLNFSFASFQICSFTDFYLSSLFWSFLCNLTEFVQVWPLISTL